MNRRSFLKNISIGAAGCFLPYYVMTRDQSAGRRPDVLFIAIDDMNDWSTLFDPKNPIKTPNLERLAQRGMFFGKAYCAARDFQKIPIRKHKAPGDEGERSGRCS